MYLDNDELFNILHMLNSTHNQGISNAIDKEKFKHRMHDQERYKQMKNEIIDELMSRISVDADVKDAILKIKELKRDLDDFEKSFK